jgi:hypothetical protein
MVRAVADSLKTYSINLTIVSLTPQKKKRNPISRKIFAQIRFSMPGEFLIIK